ncbi:MAG: efflux RND transporter periplasmic adaptor subunit [Pseudomonadota bacterium]
MWGISPRRLSILPLLLVLAAGCDDQESEAKTAEPPKVIVTEAILETVPLYLELTGRTEASITVEIQALVDGHIETRNFVEGSDVARGDTLFVIDQRPYELELEQLLGQQAKDSGSLAFANKQLQRMTELAQDGTVAPERVDQATATAQEAQGTYDSSAAAVANAQLNLAFTTVQAPIDGRVGRILQDVGNVVTGGETVLAELVQMDPMYIYLSLSEAQYLSFREHRDIYDDLPVTIELLDGTKHPHMALLDFVDPGFNPLTGTIAFRAAFPNPDDTMRPGQYAVVRIELAEQPDQVTVPAEAVGQDQAGFYVFVVDEEDKAQMRRVKIGRLYEGRRIIEEGLEAGETVIVKGLQKVRSGTTVRIERDQPSEPVEG